MTTESFSTNQITDYMRVGNAIIQVDALSLFGCMKMGALRWANYREGILVVA